MRAEVRAELGADERKAGFSARPCFLAGNGSSKGGTVTATQAL